jgi:hypothetical protein
VQRKGSNKPTFGSHVINKCKSAKWTDFVESLNVL